MRLLRKIKEFQVREDGSLLVFFCVCIVTLLGIMALSFDMGRRASTQTDMQSFADNVALAAAGELDGSSSAIANAKLAAANAIVKANETLKAGASGTTATLSFNPDTDLVFYRDLPPNDRPASYDPTALAASKYVLPTGGSYVTTDSTKAAFVGVRLNTVDVDWLFADIFGSSTLPSAAVGAIAIAGRTGWTCDISPLMFCLPPGGLTDVFPGQSIKLQTAGKDAAWNPGEFGYLDIDKIYDAVDGGTCEGLSPESRRQACLLAEGLGACVNASGVDIQTGQRVGQETAGFNLPFGIFTSTMNTLKGNPIYATGPHTISGQIHKNNCSIDQVATASYTDTMAFPPDECHDDGDCDLDPLDRFGDGSWDRTTYVDTNYTLMDDSVTPAVEVRPGSFFDFPITGLTRWQYYQLEIQRAANGGWMPGYDDTSSPFYGDPKYAPDDDGNRGATPPAEEDPMEPSYVDADGGYTTWDDYWPDTPDASHGFNPIIPEAHDVPDDGLPQCSTVDPSANIERRLVIAAGIECPASGPDKLTGDEDDVPVAQFYEVFLLAPARDTDTSEPSSPKFEIWVEVVRPIGGGTGSGVTADGVFRELVQLYR